MFTLTYQFQDCPERSSEKSGKVLSQNSLRKLLRFIFNSKVDNLGGTCEQSSCVRLSS